MKHAAVFNKSEPQVAYYLLCLTLIGIDGMFHCKNSNHEKISVQGYTSNRIMHRNAAFNGMFPLPVSFHRQRTATK
jgi:hypothetical protein